MSEAMQSFSLHAFSDLFNTPFLSHLERKLLPQYLERQQWFASKALTIKRLKVIEHFIPSDAHFALLIHETELSRQHMEHYLYRSRSNF
jgi:hypothetical protein